MTSDALSRLTAGLAADEAIALAASPNAWRPDIWQNQHGREFLVVADVTIGAPAFAISDESNGEHIARQDPASTLRRVEAVRKVIARYEFVTSHGPAVDHTRAMDMTVGATAALRDVIEMLASAYPADETEGARP